MKSIHYKCIKSIQKRAYKKKIVVVESYERV